MSAPEHRRSRPWVIALRVVVLGCFLLGALRVTFFTVYRVSGSSMLTSLLDGDRIFVWDPPFGIVDPELGQAVVLQVDGEILVKRVLGEPGDRIELVDGHVVRNGYPVPEVIGVDRRSADWLPETALAQDEYFVLGDHRRVSIDSRDFGPVTQAQMLGIVVLRMPAAGGWATVRGTLARAGESAR